VPAIATLRREQLGEASAVLARAFDDDPVFRYLYPAPSRRRWSCRGFLRTLVRDALPFGEVWAALDDGAVVATAAWLPEGAYPVSRWREVRLTVGAWGALLTPGTVGDGLRYLNATAKLHPKEPHWYLAVIGVEPERQGQGLGGQLLAEVLDRLDATGVPAYLETSTEANVAWYRHHGFEVQQEARPARAGPPLWTMWREPAAG
jgi:ribosomal protein S18 acetylase RimI-like enzyme